VEGTEFCIDIFSLWTIVWVRVFDAPII